MKQDLIQQLQYLAECMYKYEIMPPVQYYKTVHERLACKAELEKVKRLCKQNGIDVFCELESYDYKL